MCPLVVDLAIALIELLHAIREQPVGDELAKRGVLALEPQLALRFCQVGTQQIGYGAPSVGIEPEHGQREQQRILFYRVDESRHIFGSEESSQVLCALRLTRRSAPEVVQKLLDATRKISIEKSASNVTGVMSLPDETSPYPPSAALPANPNR